MRVYSSSDHHTNINIRNRNAKYPRKTSSSLLLSLVTTNLCAFIGVVFIVMVSCTLANADPGTVAKGLQARMRSPKIAHIHVLQAVAESLPKNANSTAPGENTSTNIPNGKYGKCNV